MQFAAVQDRVAPGGVGLDGPTSWRFQLGCLVAVGVVAASYVAGVVVPLVVNGLHRLPLAEVGSGAYDPKELWPADTGTLGALVRSAGLLSVVLGQPLLLLVIAMVLGTLVRWWPATPRGARALGCVTVLLTLVLLAVMWSSWGRGVSVWALD